MLDGRRGYPTWNSEQATDRLQFVGASVPFGAPRQDSFGDATERPVRFVPAMSPLGSGVCPPSLARVSTPPATRALREKPPATMENPPWQPMAIEEGESTDATSQPRSPLRVPYDQHMRFSRSCSAQGMVNKVQENVQRSHSVTGRLTGRLPCSRKVVGDILINYYPNEINAVGMLSPQHRNY